MDNHHLTNKEKYLLKKQKKNQERINNTRRKKIKKIFSIFLPIVLVVGGLIFILINYFPAKSSGIPKIIIDQQEYDFGTISIDKGLVKHTYEIKNIGNGDLKISDIKTSCMCTTAILKVGNRTSPKFGMHNNPKLWSQKITAKEIGYLEVVFDPAFHGSEGIGNVIRAVYFETNDLQNEEMEIRLLANVIK